MSNNNRNSVVILGKRYNINTTTKLNLERKNLSSLPESIGKLTKLQHFELGDNNLRSLPDWIGRLKNLRGLSLYGNNLTSLPESFGRLTKLEKLVLNQNELTSLPESIGNLTNLEKLDLGWNKLTSLPESFGRLTNLRELWSNENKLTSLPESFKNLRSDIEIKYNYRRYTRDEFIKLFIRRRVSKNTELFNRTISKTNKLPPKNKRVYINTPTNVKPNGELRRLYNKNGINQYMNDKNVGRLSGGHFRKSNVKNLKNTNTVNKNVYLRNIKSRLQNSTTLNNLKQTVERIKTNLPSNVKKNDVNNMVHNMKPQILQKIFNKLKNSPPNNRVRIMNTMDNRGFMNQNDITAMKKKLNNFV
jgi:Leucine-rich repeat (LRR) protein